MNFQPDSTMFSRAEEFNEFRKTMAGTDFLEHNSDNNLLGKLNVTNLWKFDSVNYD